MLYFQRKVMYFINLIYALIKIVAHIRAKHVVYISCKPTSLARDLIVMQQHGYKVLRACAVDQFPGTLHIETVCRLELTE